ncbi:MAG: zinc-ribbon domain-containing protein [Acutalibacteraceae bacterium]
MYCKKCGAEIVADAKFCESCGTAVEAVPVQPENTPEVTQTEQKPEVTQVPPVTETVNPQTAAEVFPANPEPTAEAVPQSGRKKRVKFKDLPPKEKKKRAIIGCICLLIALIFMIGDGLSAVGKSRGKNDYIVKTGNDDMFGGVSFDMTLEEFVDTYNIMIEKNAEYDSVAKMESLDIDDFKEADSGVENLTLYSYFFGYSRGSYPYVFFTKMAELGIFVNNDTGLIQEVQYLWRPDGYNTDQSEEYYYFELPAKIFSVVYSELDYPFGDDYSDYQDLLLSLDSNKPYKFTGNMIYGLFETDDFLHIEFVALTKDSEAYSIAK